MTNRLANMIVVEVVPKFKLAGAERMAESLICGLVDLGVEVYAASLYDFESPITSRLRGHAVPVQSFGKRDGLDLSIVGKLRRYFKAVHPDIVHTHLYAAKYAIPAAHAAGVPACLHTVHNIASEDLSGIDTILQRWFYSHGWAVPVAISPEIKKTVSEEYGIPGDEVPMVLNGVARRTFPKSDAKSDNMFTFLHIGRFEYVKNHELLLDAFKRVHATHKDCRLVLVGKGPLLERIRRKVEDLELDKSVNIVGEVADVAPYLAEADVFVLPSEYEGLPITLIEALQAGLPCIASNVGGIPDIVQDGENGLLIEPKIDSVAQAMTRVLEDRGLLSKLARNALNVDSPFTQEKMSRAYYRIMQEVTSDERMA